MRGAPAIDPAQITTALHAALYRILGNYRRASHFRNKCRLIRDLPATAVPGALLIDVHITSAEVKQMARVQESFDNIVFPC